MDDDRPMVSRRRTSARRLSPRAHLNENGVSVRKVSSKTAGVRHITTFERILVRE